MSIGLRIKELRMSLKMNQVDFAKELSIKQSPLSQMESGRILPSIETISTIIRKFNITYSWLIDGEEEKPNVQDLKHNESVTKSVTFIEETKSKENVTVSKRMPLVVTIDNTGKDNVVLVPVKAAAGYLSGYGDVGFIQKLPTFSLPNINNGTFRMFQVGGHSMYPTISDGSFVVGEWVEDWFKDIKDNRIYVVICNEGILVKRVLNRLKKYGNLFLKSDNRKEYPSINLEPTQIMEVWAVKMHISYDLPDPSILYDRVSDLEAEIQYIKSTLKRKN